MESPFIEEGQVIQKLNLALFDETDNRKSLPVKL